MMFSRETFIYDAELEIIVPNDILDCNEEKVDCIIGAKQRTQIFYDELLHCYLVTTLPPESNLENKEAATEFFKNLEITLEATLINTNLAMASDYSSQLVHRVPSSSSSSSISGMFSSGRASIRSRSSSNSTSSTSPTVPGSPASDYSFKKFGKYTEGSIIYSAQYNSKSKNYDEMVVVERDGRWICVLPLSFPVAYIRTRAHGQITLSVSVAQPQRYSVETFENFGMNLLGGLSDDPAFESLNAVCSIPTSRFTRQDPIKKTTALASTHKTLPVKPMLNVRIKVTNVSNTLMMSVELENDTDHDISLSIEDVKIEVAHAFVTRYGWSLEASNDKFPILLRPVDQVTLLYNVTILEDSSFPRALNTQQHCPTPIPHSEASSRRGSIASIASINPILNTLPVENKHRILSIIVKACPVIDGIKSRYIESKRSCMLDISTLLSNPTTAAHNPFNLNNINNYNSYGASGVGLGINSNKNDVDGNNGILPSGRLPKLQKQVNSDVCDGGVSVSFMVCGKPVVGRVFTIKVFMVNNSKQVRKFTIMIPNKKRPDERLLQSQSSPSILLSQTTDITLVESSNIENVKSLRNPFMDETEFLRKQLEFEATDANLICLDDNVKVCSIEPYKSQSATLHFVSIKEALQVVELVQLVDNDTGFVTNLRNVVQVDVKRSARNQRRIDHDSVVLRHIEVTG